MDPSGAEAQGGTGKDTAPSTSNPPGKTEDGAKPEKAPLKRVAAKPTKGKAKKLKKDKTPDFTVQQGEDMLLVISSSKCDYLNQGRTWAPSKKRDKRKKAGAATKGKGKAIQIKKKPTARARPRQTLRTVTKEKEDTYLCVPRDAKDHRWGQSLPEEVLINIFKMVVVQDGAVPFLCRVGRVCRLWTAAASSPILWRKVSLSHCWIAPERVVLLSGENRIKDTVNWLAKNRFSQLRDFSLHHWIKNVDFAVQVVSQFCPHLRSLKLAYCKGLTAEAFQSLGLHSRSLQSIDLQYSEFQIEGLVKYLESHGSQIKQILITHAMKNERLLHTISRGCCPDLELLEVNTKLDSTYLELPLYIHVLQAACPKLKTLRLLNVIPMMHKTIRKGSDSTLGFPLLEELCLATTSCSYMTDKDLSDILFGSTGLRVLDLRGCSRITTSGLTTLPCLELECLFWGQYGTKVGLPSCKEGLHMVTQKWSRTLQQLDITNQLSFTEEDLETAMSHLAQVSKADTLRSLNLTGTRITPPALRSVISHMTAITYLNLTSCRYLPRGVKRIYRGQEDIRQLLDTL